LPNRRIDPRVSMHAMPFPVPPFPQTAASQKPVSVEQESKAVRHKMEYTDGDWMPDPGPPLWARGSERRCLH
jgi:hypothetical protein